MQRFAGVAPGRGRQFRPGRFQRTRDFMRIAHAPPYTLSSTFSLTRRGRARSGPAFIFLTFGDWGGARHRLFGGLSPQGVIIRNGCYPGTHAVRARRGTGRGNTNAAQSPRADCAPVDRKRAVRAWRESVCPRYRWGGTPIKERRPHRISHAVSRGASWRSPRSCAPDSARRRARFRTAGGCRRRR